MVDVTEDKDTMKYLQLIWATLFRRKVRAILTLLSVVLAFLLFGLLDSVRDAFAQVGAYVPGADRRITISKVSYTLPLPLSLYERIRAVPGVADVTYASWFGGVYQDPRNFFPSQAVAGNYVNLYPEIQLSPQQERAFRETRSAALVGESLARKFHWKVGDKIPFKTAFSQKDGSNTWTFDLVGIYRTHNPELRSEDYFENTLLIRWDYFDEARESSSGTVGWYVVKAADSHQVERIGRAIDALSAGSDHETKTQSEQELSAAYYGQLADVGLIVHGIMAAVFFTLILIAGNTMVQSVRERTTEIAVLKTLGFTNVGVLGLILGESILMCMLGGLIGLICATFSVKSVPALFGTGLLVASVGPAIWLRSVELIIFMGIAVALVPALRGMRLRIVDGLR